jgi:predicted nuclease with TOPRIM domain
MDAVRIWKLTEVLELTEEQTMTFLPQVQIHERKLRGIQKELESLSIEGQKLRKQKNISQKEVNKLIQQYTDKQKQVHMIKQEFIQSLPKYLSPEQQLLYIGFEARFRKDLRQYMKDRKGSRSQGRPERP